MDEVQVTKIIGELVRYLRANPLACDSAGGIARWWLQGADEVSMETLLLALAWLRTAGVVEEIVGADGRTRFRRCGSDRVLDVAIAMRESIDHGRQGS